MKLGTETGSLMNSIMANFGTTDIKLGETGATILKWSDRNACTVVESFKKGKFNYLVVQTDRVTRVDDNGMSDMQFYNYERDTNGAKYTFRITEKGYENVRLNENGRYVKTGVYGLMVGKREEFYDFTF